MLASGGTGWMRAVLDAVARVAACEPLSLVCWSRQSVVVTVSEVKNLQVESVELEH